MRNRVTVVLGTMPDKHGSIYGDYQERIERAVEEVVLHPNDRNVIVLTGGHTVVGVDSEAVCGEVYLWERLRERGLDTCTTVLLEQRSPLSSKNISYVHERLRRHERLWPDHLLIVARKEYRSYADVIASWLDWGEGCVVTITGVSGSYRAREVLLYRYVLTPAVALCGPQIGHFLLSLVAMVRGRS